MINKNKLTIKDAALILGRMAPITLSRISKTDPDFPKIEKVGRSAFIDRALFYKWLSKKAGMVVEERGQILTSKDLQVLFQKSHTWIWQNVKSGSIPKPFRINRSTFWVESQVEAIFREVVQR